MKWVLEVLQRGSTAKYQGTYELGSRGKLPIFKNTMLLEENAPSVTSNLSESVKNLS